MKISETKCLICNNPELQYEVTIYDVEHAAILEAEIYCPACQETTGRYAYGNYYENPWLDKWYIPNEGIDPDNICRQHKDCRTCKDHTCPDWDATDHFYTREEYEDFMTEQRTPKLTKEYLEHYIQTMEELTLVKALNQDITHLYQQRFRDEQREILLEITKQPF